MLFHPRIDAGAHLRRRSASAERLMATRRNQKQACAADSILANVCPLQKDILAIPRPVRGRRSCARPRKDHRLVLVHELFKIRLQSRP